LKHSFVIATTAVGMLFAAVSMKAADPDEGAAIAYCTQSGGKVINRVPMYGTNGPSSSWLQLTSIRKFCQFTSATDGSRIHILVQDLYATAPSLAVLAYYAKVTPGTPGPGNPASYYCTQLGGSDLFGGVNAAGGGWFGEGSEDAVLEACIFPDMSSIDSWGLTYNAVGVIRGIDLTTVLRYAPPPSAKQ
jgi:putative hemolysin